MPRFKRATANFGRRQAPSRIFLSFPRISVGSCTQRLMCCSEMLRRYCLLLLLAAWLGAWIAISRQRMDGIATPSKARCARLRDAAFLGDVRRGIESFFVCVKRLGATRAARPSRFSRVDCTSVKLPFREFDAPALKSVAARET